MERRRLLDTLAGRRDRRVAVLCAPAGYGKTILATQLSRDDPRSTGWLALDESDNDPMVMLEDTVSVLEDLGTPRVDGIFSPLLQQQLEQCAPFQLVLDDLEVLTHPRSLALVALLVDQAPEGSQVVLVTRNEPEVPLSRLRAAGDVLDVGAADLALDLTETRQLLATDGVRLSDSEVDDIRERAEGWAAGIALAMLSRRGLVDLRPGDIAHSQAVGGFLLEEAVEGQPPDVRRFLLASSLLRRMSPALCDAALGIGDSARILGTLERASLFVVPLGADGGWYRYHHIFRELLQTELRRQAPELIPDVLRRAAAWHEANGDPTEAFEYAHAAGDLAAAGRTLLGSTADLVARGQIETLRGWLARCSPDEIASDAQLAIGGAWVALLSGDAAEATHLVTVADTTCDLDVPAPDGAPSLHSYLANLRGTLAPRGITQMLRDGEFLCAAEGARGETRWVIDGRREIGTAHLLAGRLEDAIDAFAEALSLTRGRPELDHLTFHCLGYSALAAADLGDWRRARRWARDAHALVNESGLVQTVQSAPAYTAQATVLQHDGLLSQATKALASAERNIAMLHALRWAEADIALRCAEVNLAMGEVDKAWALADVAQAALAHYPDAGLLPGRLEALGERLRSGRVLAFTPSELRVVPFLASHLSLQEIGDRLFLSRATVKTHTVSIYRKLDVSSRSAAVERLDALGLAGGTQTPPLA